MAYFFDFVNLVNDIVKNINNARIAILDQNRAVLYVDWITIELVNESKFCRATIHARFRDKKLKLEFPVLSVKDFEHWLKVYREHVFRVWMNIDRRLNELDRE